MDDFSDARAAGKADFQKNVDQKRSQRELDRKKRTAAVLIQKIQRGNRARAVWAAAVAADLSRKLHDTAKLKTVLLAQNKPFAMPAKILCGFMASVCAVARACPKTWPTSFCELAPLVSSAARSSQASFSALAAENGAVWAQVERFVLLCASCVVERGGHTGLGDGKLQMLGALATLLNPGEWPEGHRPPRAVLDRWMRRVYESYWSALFVEVFERAPAANLLPSACDLTSDRIKRFVALLNVARSLHVLDEQGDFYHLWIELLVVPGVARWLLHVDDSNAIRWQGVFQFRALLGGRIVLGALLGRRKGGMQAGDCDNFFLGNVLDVVNSGVVGDRTWAWAAIAISLRKAPLSVFPNHPSVSVDEMKQVSWLRASLTKLVDPDEAAKLFSSALRLQQAATDISEMSVVCLCRVYSAVFAKLESAMRMRDAPDRTFATILYFSLLNRLAFMSSGQLPKAVWRFAAGFCDCGNTNAVTPFGQDDWISCAHVMAAVYCQLLNVVSDSDLLSKQGSPLVPAPELPAMIQDLTYVSVIRLRDGERLSAHEIQNSSHDDSARLLTITKFLCVLFRAGTRVTLPNVQPHVWRAAPKITDEILAGQHKQLLARLPHAVPLQIRIQLLYQHIEKVRMYRNRTRPISRKIRREYLFEDGLSGFGDVDDWRFPFYIVFINSAGQQEPGQDAGGLFKEYWEQLTKLAFGPDYGLFCATSERLLYPNPQSGVFHGRGHARLFSFLGSVLGKAIIEGIVVDPQFALFFLSKMLGRKPSYYDLQFYDPQLFKNLEMVKTYAGDVENDLGLTFSTDGFDGREVNLVPNGANLSVTARNRFEYIYLLSDYKLNKQIAQQADAFLAGFSKVVDVSWLSMFSEKEMQMVISGVSSAIDVEDLKKHAKYIDYKKSDKRVKWFWKIMAAWDSDMRSNLLRFTTSCGRAPLMGFATLQPPFTLSFLPIKRDADKLPIASTCFNILKLPNYSSQTVMRQKLEMAVTAASGFELE